MKSLSVFLQTLRYMVLFTNKEPTLKPCAEVKISELFSLAQDETFNIFLFSLEAVKMRKQWHVQ